MAHPGFALSVYTPIREGVRLRSRADRPIRRRLMRAVAQGKDTGAWPLVQALTDPAALNGQCWGPGGFLGLKGLPAVAAVGHRARERNAASRLITASERLTGVTLAV